jgi:hypothetical protein
MKNDPRDGQNNGKQWDEAHFSPVSRKKGLDSLPSLNCTARQRFGKP